ncbi:MAG: phosphoribosylformylglycinamidine synthase subunit PurL [Dehalococcoidia bacterium]|nr:phosphoribosylformylglycinamidine synthase subunit PurL [Chloroflexota bacterium]MCZ6866932.1 phosphoribosylformylglycinamidine synthase subunit PurL [Chloroflexota bacterium]
MSPVSKEVLDEIALTEEEYELIVDLLGREPNSLELGMFGALWSEHCGYKHSKPLLRLLPSQSPRVLLPPGQENAGAVDIGDGLAVVFKIESHNHPSAIEPFQGAATGVGGIVRDILAMGARPIALLNSLRFGPLDDSRNRHLFNGVVGGISWYGNCIGVPDVGGEIAFSKSYSGNPLVNALCVGLVEKDKLTRATVGAEGNLLLLAGSGTGRDGIHGASGLASRTFEVDQEMRPAVQVGNPFLEKVLIEACLEAASTKGLVGIQDLGAAGLTSSTVEAADRGGSGIRIDVSKVHRREGGMNPYEVMLSESQERMLLVTSPEGKGELVRVLEKWDLPWVEMGWVEKGNRARIFDGEKPAADLPVKALTEPELYRLKGSMSEEAKKARSFPLSQVPLPDNTPEEVLLTLLKSPNIASKEYVYRQYDNQVQTNTVLVPGAADAALLRIKGTKKGIAISTDGNGRYCYLDPYRGGAIAVAEACRNVSCVGASPIALTDCLNFGDPERPEIYYQLEWCIRGIARACRALNVPVVSGNVSLYNETRGEAVYPTPVIGALGLTEDVQKHATAGFKNEGDLVILLGASGVEGRVSHLAGSEYLEVYHDLVVGRPAIDLELEGKVQSLCRRVITEGVISSAHDCSDGGLAVALAEACISGGLGFKGNFSIRGRWDAALFGEAQSRIVVSLPPGRLADLERLAGELVVPVAVLGIVEGERIRIGDMVDSPLSDIDQVWRNGLEEALTQEPR